jgi:hypothetical protein
MSNYDELRKLIIQGLPIALIIVYLLFHESFMKVSSQPLGKCIAICLILFYTLQDMMFGFIVCLLIILFYQREMEGFLSKSTQEYVDFLPKQSVKEDSIRFENHVENDFTSVKEAYPEKLLPIRKASEHLFRKEFCSASESRVYFKDQPVKNSLISHVYPELTFRDGECNPCDLTCHFSIDRKHDVEHELQSKSSKV